MHCTFLREENRKMERFRNFSHLIVRRQNSLKGETSRAGLCKDMEQVVKTVLRKEL